MEYPSKFELHYYLADKSHSMNAMVRNKCEGEFLAVATEVAEILGIHIELDCEALQEGGIREVWKALGENNAQIALIISTLALIWSIVPNTDQELIDLQKEDLRLSIEQRKLALGKIKNDVESNQVTLNTIEVAVKAVSGSYKLATRKSNFYKILSTYEKVTQVGFNELSSQGCPLNNERIIVRDEFQKFIITSQELKPIRNSSAYIEIVAPVLTDGKSKWKGIYDGNAINFSMDDDEFRRSVFSKQLSFKNGDGIVCVLLIYKKVDELGEIITSGYSVEVVLENIHSGVSSSTVQGKKYLHAKKMIDGQGDLFGPNNP